MKTIVCLAVIDTCSMATKATPFLIFITPMYAKDNIDLIIAVINFSEHGAHSQTELLIRLINERPLHETTEEEGERETPNIIII